VRICLTALNAYPVVDPLADGPIGGVETRAWLLARGLAAQPDLSIQLVVRHPQPPRLTSSNGVEIVPLVDPLFPLWQSLGACVEHTVGFPGLRIRRWDWRLLWWLPRLAVDRLIRGRVYASDRPDPRLIQLQADVYGTFGVQTHSAVVIRSAHAADRPAVLFLGSDGDLDPIFETGGTARDPYGTRADVGRFILQTADLIIAQTEAQQRQLRDRFGRNAEVLTTGLDRYVLWVGRAESVHKRPQLCLEVARRCPEVSFLMILNPRDPGVEAEIRRTAPAHVRIIERIPVPQMPAVFRRAALLLNTSRLEGFPNVFLQAALSGVPIASLEVGEEFLRAAEAGECFHGDLEALASTVKRWWSHPPSAAGSAAACYVRQHHGLAQQAARLALLLRGASVRTG
jgi:hypothetical protein